MRELEIAALAARRAGDVVRRYSSARQAPSIKSAPDDLVTAVDREAERVIRQVILEAFPDHDILGEEEGGTASGARPLWIVDPLDGTNNFVQMLPFYCVSVALAVGGQVVSAAIFDPHRDELFTASLGGGAALNGEPMRVDTAAHLAEGIISTRTPYLHGEGRVENLEAYGRCAARCRSMRNLGAAALEMAWVAAGRLTAFWEMRLNTWDRAAGALLVTEADGRVSSPDGSELPLLPRCGVLASNGRVHAELVNLVNESR